MKQLAQLIYQDMGPGLWRHRTGRHCLCLRSGPAQVPQVEKIWLGVKFRHL